MIEYNVKVFEDRTEWRLDGSLHREDGPAVEYANGTKFWYRHGKISREDGPACEYSDGTKLWYLDGHPYVTESAYRIKLANRNNSCNGKVVEIDGKKYQLKIERHLTLTAI